MSLEEQKKKIAELEDKLMDAVLNDDKAAEAQIKQQIMALHEELETMKLSINI
jgi:hypothetical protein